MKIKSKWLIACTGLCLVSTTGLAAIEFGLSASENDFNSLRSNFYREGRVQSQNFTDSRALIGATVRDPQGDRLGRVHQVVLSPRNGEAFAAVNVGHGTYALIPIQALTVTTGTGLMNATEVTVNSTRDHLDNGPIIRNGDWAQLDNPTFTQSIYNHYQLQPPAAVGGTGNAGLGGSSTGTQQSPGTPEQSNPKQP